MRKSGLTGDEAYVLSKHGKATEDLGPLKKEIGLLKEDLGNKITKFYASNEGKNHLADSDDGKIADMMVYGKSEQKSTMGKNLLKLSEANAQGNAQGLSATMNADGSISVTGASTSTWSNIIKINNECHTDNATYTFSVDKNSGIIIGLKLGRTELDDANYQTHRIMQNQLSCTFETGASNEYCSLFLEGLTVGKSYNFTIYPMLELGTEATAYEPYTGGQPSPSPDYPQEIKNVVNPTVKVSNEDGTKSQTITLPYTLNAIPVSSGGNITIDGQQYVSDYVDVERGKLVRMIIQKKLKELKWNNDTKYQTALNESNGYVSFRSKNVIGYLKEKQAILCKNYIFVNNGWNIAKTLVTYVDGLMVNDIYSNFGLENWSTDAKISSNIFGDTTFFAELVTPQEIDLTSDQIQAFKSLATNYPVTNIEVSSDQLDGLTVFNYPISMANGWNYVKQQIGDTREYIYDIDTRTQDIDTQSAEAYVNSEYAVALTELEV